MERFVVPEAGDGQEMTNNNCAVAVAFDIVSDFVTAILHIQVVMNGN